MSDCNINIVREPVAILGFGVEGRATLSYLKKLGIKDVTILDQKVPDDAPDGIKAVFGENYDSNLEKYSTVFRSPGIRPDISSIKRAKNNGSKITSAMSYFLQNCPAKTIGVTGTLGKGTAASLTAAMLEKAGLKVHLGGNIGKNPLDFLSEVKPHDIVVLEISSFQAIDLAASPDICVILKTTVEHLDWHKDENEYLNSKAGILLHQKSEDLVIYNSDVKGSKVIAQKSAGRKMPFSTKNQLVYGLFLKDDRLCYQNEKEKITLAVDPEKMLLKGHFNLENIAAAVLAAHECGASFNDCACAAMSFRGLPHRLEFVADFKDVNFYNDSYATRPEAAIAAIECFVEPLAVILGGSEKNVDFSMLANEISANTNIVHIGLIGTTAGRLRQAIERLGTCAGKIEDYVDLDKALKGSYESLNGKGTVLMSPACASFGLFENYKHRGVCFRKAVDELVSLKNKAGNLR